MTADMHDRHAGEGKDRILHEARELFLRRGYVETSMQEIAEATGLTKAAIYYHFKDKDDLYAYVIKREMERHQRNLVAVIDGPGTSRERLAATCRLSLERVHTDMVQLMRDFHTHLTPERQQQIKCEVASPVVLLQPLFAEAAASGEIRADLDPVMLAALVFSMLMGQMMLFHSGQIAAIDPPAMAETIVDVLFQGIAARMSTTGAVPPTPSFL